MHIRRFGNHERRLNCIIWENQGVQYIKEHENQVILKDVIQQVTYVNPILLQANPNLFYLLNLLTKAIKHQKKNWWVS